MAKRKIKLKAGGAGRLVEIMERLGELDIDLEAEGRPGAITVVLHGSKEEIRQSIAKLRELMGGCL
jgi:hypothetical protein